MVILLYLCALLINTTLSSHSVSRRHRTTESSALRGQAVQGSGDGAYSAGDIRRGKTDVIKLGQVSCVEIADRRDGKSAFSAFI